MNGIKFYPTIPSRCWYEKLQCSYSYSCNIPNTNYRYHTIEHLLVIIECQVYTNWLSIY